MGIDERRGRVRLFVEFFGFSLGHAGVGKSGRPLRTTTRIFGIGRYDCRLWRSVSLGHQPPPFALAPVRTRLWHWRIDPRIRFPRRNPAILPPWKTPDQPQFLLGSGDRHDTPACLLDPRGATVQQQQPFVVSVNVLENLCGCLCDSLLDSMDPRLLSHSRESSLAHRQWSDRRSTPCPTPCCQNQWTQSRHHVSSQCYQTHFDYNQNGNCKGTQNLKANGRTVPAQQDPYHSQAHGSRLWRRIPLLWHTSRRHVGLFHPNQIGLFL